MPEHTAVPGARQRSTAHSNGPHGSTGPTTASTAGAAPSFDVGWVSHAGPAGGLPAQEGADVKATKLTTRQVPVVTDEMRAQGGVIAHVFAAELSSVQPHHLAGHVPALDDHELGWFHIPEAAMPWRGGGLYSPDWEMIHTAVAHASDSVHDGYRDEFKTVKQTVCDRGAEGEIIVDLRIDYTTAGTAETVRMTYFLEAVQ